MPDDFQQTIDLREKVERQKRAAAAKNSRQDWPGATAPLEKIYQTGPGDEAGPDLGKIEQPRRRDARPCLSTATPQRAAAFRMVVFILAGLVVCATVYFLFFRHKNASPDLTTRAWYAVKLVDGEIFYGQILDVKADPVNIANVYYNYDQAKQAGAAKEQTKAIEETGNIRLVKRGKETHGPDGSMNVVRAQVLFMEPLKADSKVLKAILDYEK